MTLYLRLVILQARLCIRILYLEDQILDQIASDRALMEKIFGSSNEDKEN